MNSDDWFAAVCEEGPGNITVYTFGSEEKARKRTGTMWSSWVLYRCSEDRWQELGCGGMGLWVGAAGTIRRHVEANLAPTGAACAPDPQEAAASTAVVLADAPSLEKPTAAAAATTLAVAERCSYVVVCEEGPGSFKTYSYGSEESARKQTGAMWSSWVLYRCSEDHWQELGCGGVGLWVGAAGTIRRHVEANLAPRGVSGRAAGAEAGTSAAVKQLHRKVIAPHAPHAPPRAPTPPHAPPRPPTPPPHTPYPNPLHIS